MTRKRQTRSPASAFVLTIKHKYAALSCGCGGLKVTATRRDNNTPSRAVAHALSELDQALLANSNEALIWVVEVNNDPNEQGND